MNLNFITKLFRREKWPEGKDVKWTLTSKDDPRETVIYLSNRQMAIITGLINLGTQVAEMPIIITAERESTQEEFIQ